MTTPDDSIPDGERRYGLDELVELAFEAEEDGQAHERYQILRRLLGVSTDMLLSGGGPDAPRSRKRHDDRGRPLPRSVGAPGLAHNTVLAAKDGKSPFSGYLEAPPDVIALYAAHRDEIDAAVGAGSDELLVALRRLATAALRSAEPDTADRSVTLAEIRAEQWNCRPPSSASTTARPDASTERPIETVTGDLRIHRHGHGPAAVLIHVPHAGTHIPPGVRADLLLDDRGLADELDAMTDWHTDRLATTAAVLAAADGHPTVVATNTLSRLVIDPERFPDDTEVMNGVGMGAVYQRTSRGSALRHPDPERDRALLDNYFRPYADALADLVDELLAESGRCLIIDLHSYPSVALPYELDPTAARPAVCLGTDQFHTPPELTADARAAFADAPGTIGENTPFAGTYVPLRHYRRERRVTSLMIEMRRDTYLTEPNIYDERRAEGLARRIARLGARRGLDA